MGTFRDRLLVMCSCSRVKAAGAWPTPMSSCARLRTFSGFWCGGGGYRDTTSQYHDETIAWGEG